MAATAQNTNNTTIRSEGKLAHLPLIPLPYLVASQAARDAYNALYDAQNKVAYLMLGSMSPELHRAIENNKAYDMIQELRTMFEEQAKQELFETVKAFYACKQEEGILKKAETLVVLAIQKCMIRKDKRKPRGAKGKDKGKNKLAYAPKPKIPPPPKRDNLTKDSICHHCKEVGYWRRNCPSHQAELKRKEASMASTSAVEVIRSFDLILPSGLIIVLDNCYFAPTVTRGVVSISRLVENGYSHTFTNYGISVSKDNVFYFNAISHDGIYEIDMHNLYPNVSSTFNVSNKRVKYSLDSSYLWHCRLGHINKKRMDKLLRDGILQSTHDESLEKCKSCIFGKMARKPFLHKVERAKDLLGLIHTDVFQNEVENQLGKKIKALRSDRGGEFLSHEFVNHIKSYGIVSRLTSPCTPQHNGVSKGYALESTARILNMVPTKKVERMPYEIWHGKDPKLSYLRVWGCYPKETMGYYFYYPPENKIFVARNVEFFENNLIIQEASWSHGPLKMSGSDEGLELIQEEDTQPSKNTSEEHNKVMPMEVEPQNVKVPIRRSERIPQAPDIYGFYVDVDEYELGDLNEPPNYKAALSDVEYDKWIEFMNTKMQSMKDNQVWILVELPPNGQTIRSKWLFKKKTDMDGNVHTFKARLVVKDYTQTVTPR
ncbi:retrotransposon protein, putative, ty1-copia subclass [Tanacetum coccineum]